MAAAFVFGVLAHEVATARVADLFGDKSPKMHGRTRLALGQHADVLGTYILPAVFVVAALFGSLLGLIIVPFGYGRRHDLNPLALRHPKRDIVVVALAGPIATLTLAILTGLAYRGGTCGSLTLALYSAAYVLATMTVVELVPLPGRDGARILGRFLSPAAAMKLKELEQYDVAFVLLFIVILGGVAKPMVEALLQPILGPSPCLFL